MEIIRAKFLDDPIMFHTSAREERETAMFHVKHELEAVKQSVKPSMFHVKHSEPVFPLMLR